MIPLLMLPGELQKHGLFACKSSQVKNVFVDMWKVVKGAA